MKKTYTLLLALVGLTLFACTAKSSPASKESSSATKQSTSKSSSSSSSTEEASSSASSAATASRDFFESQEDTEKVLAQLTGLDALPEWASFRAIQLDDGISITSTDENGNTTEVKTGEENPNPYTYQDVVNMLGAPTVDFTSFMVWQTGSLNIRVSFRGDYATEKGIEGLPNAQTISATAVDSISEGTVPEKVIQQLGQPYGVSATTRSTTLTWKDDKDQTNMVQFSNGLVTSTTNGTQSANMQKIISDSAKSSSSGTTP